MSKTKFLHHELWFVGKRVDIQEIGGHIFALTDCKRFQQIALIKIPLTEDQAERLIERHLTHEKIQDILPDMDRSLREIFVSGVSPAEWEFMFTGQRRSWRYYRDLGYEFDCEQATEEYLDEMDRELDATGLLQK